MTSDPEPRRSRSWVTPSRLLWAVLAGYGYARWKRNPKSGWIIGGLVLSHWILDAISHRRDLPVLPGGPYVGGGLWFSLPLTLMVEGKRKFIGHIGQYKGSRAFKVSRPIAPKDRV